MRLMRSSTRHSLTRYSLMRYTLAAVPLALAAITVLAADLGAQRRTVRRQQPIEIRGQVPTPQVVTVRPREVPQYNRRFLVPNFYDHDFWPVILPGYQLVSRRLVSGNSRLDSLVASGADSARMADSVRMAGLGRAAIGIGLLTRPNIQPRVPGDTTRAPATPATPTTPADTTRRTSPTSPAGTTGGTPPASGRR